MDKWEPTPEQRNIAEQKARDQTARLLPHQRGKAVIQGAWDRTGLERARLAEMGADPTAILDEPDDYKSPLVPAAITGGITRGPLYIMSTVTTRYSIPPLPMTSVSFTTRIHALFPTVTSSSNSITYTRVEEKEKPERPKRVSPRPPKTIDAALNKKRHGVAAVCPQHGPTRGGMCRLCARAQRVARRRG